MKEFATPATNVISKLQQNQFLRHIKSPNMKVSATLVIIVNIEQHQLIICGHMLTQFIKVSVTPAVSVIIKHLWQVILRDMLSRSMKVFVILVINAITKLHITFY